MLICAAIVVSYTCILVNKRNDTKIKKKYVYVKTKTIVYYHLRQCFRETNKTQNKE